MINSDKIIISSPCRIHITPLPGHIHDDRAFAYSLAIAIQVPRILMKNSKLTIIPKEINVKNKGVGAGISETITILIHEQLYKESKININDILSRIKVPMYRGIDILTLLYGGLILGSEVLCDDVVKYLIPITRCTVDLGFILYIPAGRIRKERIVIDEEINILMFKDVLKIINGALLNDFTLFIEGLRNIEQYLQYLRARTYGSRYLWDSAEELENYIKNKYNISILCQSGSGPTLYTPLRSFNQALTLCRKLKEDLESKFDIHILACRSDNMGLRIKVYS